MSGCLLRMIFEIVLTHMSSQWSSSSPRPAWYPWSTDVSFLSRSNKGRSLDCILINALSIKEMLLEGGGDSRPEIALSIGKYSCFKYHLPQAAEF